MSKNKLQEYFQKQKLPLPLYSSTRIGDLWQATVQIHGSEQGFTGDPCSKKVMSESSAAEKALVYVQSLPAESRVGTTASRCIPSFDFSKKWTKPIYVLVDYENVNKLEKLGSTVTDGFVLEKFVSYINQKAQTDEPTCIVNACGSDSIDHYISSVVGMLIQEYTRHHDELEELSIIIVTRDKFAASHLEFWRHPKVKVYHTVSEDTTIQLLEQIVRSPMDQDWPYNVTKTEWRGQIRKIMSGLCDVETFAESLKYLEDTLGIYCDSDESVYSLDLTDEYNEFLKCLASDEWLTQTGAKYIFPKYSLAWRFLLDCDLIRDWTMDLVSSLVAIAAHTSPEILDGVTNYIYKNRITSRFPSELTVNE